MGHFRQCAGVFVATDDDERILQDNVILHGLHLGFVHRLMLFLHHLSIGVAFHAATSTCDDHIGVHVLTTMTHTIEEESIDMLVIMMASALRLLEVRHGLAQCLTAICPDKRFTHRLRLCCDRHSARHAFR